MAFDFLGTFNRTQFEQLFEYAEAQLENADPRIVYLKSQIERLGWIEYEFDENGDRVNYSILPETSQLAKYARAYEFYGGDLTALQIRSRGDWIFLTKGEFDLSESKPYAGNRPSVPEKYARESKHFDDTTPGNAVARLKDWLIPGIKRKLEDLEFRIKRNIDLTDQHIEEIVLLIKRSTGAETIQDIREDVELFLSSEEFASASEDQ